MPELEKEKKAKKYALEGRILSVITLVTEIAFLVWFLFSGASILVRDYCMSLTGNYYGIVFAYFIIFFAILETLSLPFSFVSGFLVEHRYGQSNRTFGGWCWDEIKGVAVSIILGGISVEVLYLIIKKSSSAWWIIASLVFTFFSVILARLAPVLLMPLFYKFTPIEDEGLKDRLLELARRGGAEVNGIFSMNLSKTTKAANAALMGLGKTRRIVISDTMLSSYTPQEIETVIAHELGHQKGRHLLKMLLWQTVLIFISFKLIDAIFASSSSKFGFTGMSDIASLPLFILIASFMSLVTLPAINSFSRSLESYSDRFAFLLTGNAEAFRMLMERLAEQNLADKNPNGLIEFAFHSHPSIAKRIDYVSKLSKDKKE